MNIEELSRGHKLELLYALNFTKDIGCPSEEFRVKGHIKCFHCNECWRYALMNSLPLDYKREDNEFVEIHR